MKIGIYDPYLDDLGGGEKYMLAMAQCLSSDHEVVIFWDTPSDFEEITQRFQISLSHVTLAKNIFSRKVGLLERLFATKEYDVIIFLSDGSVPFVLSKKLLLHVQQPLHIRRNSLKDTIKLNRVYKIFCNSQYTKSFIQKQLAREVFVLYPPVALYPKDTEKENIILHVGRFRVKNVGVGDYKKQEVMVNAFKKMCEQGLRGWKFVLAVSIKDDDREKFEELRKAAAGLPIEFLVNKNNRELWELYNKAKIYWHASGYGENLEQHPEYAEHFGISTVEAMGAGAVPVVIHAGGQKEIVTNGKNGMLWRTLGELQKKTLQLMDDSVLLTNMSQAARKRAETFAGNRFCQEVKNLIV